MTAFTSPLDSFHRAFASFCAQAFAQHLAFPLRANALPATELSYRDHLLTLADSTFLLVFTSTLFPGEFALEFHPSLVYLILEHLLGGSEPDPLIPRRRFTQLESRLLAPVFGEIPTILASAWPSPTTTAQDQNLFTLSRIESDPRTHHIVPDHERVISLPIEFTGPPRPLSPFTNPPPPPRLTLALPAPATAVLGHTSGSLDPATPIPFRAILAETSLSASELASLQPGDILTTDLPLSADLTIIAAPPHRMILQGRLAKLHNRKAIRITRPSVRH